MMHDGFTSGYTAFTYCFVVFHEGPSDIQLNESRNSGSDIISLF
jgi:hypothetical protein